MERVRQAQSRLFIIDAAKTPGTLLGKYTDRKKYWIVRGVVGLLSLIHISEPTRPY